MDVALESVISKVQVSQKGLDLKSGLLSENINIQIHRTEMLPFSLYGRQ